MLTSFSHGAECRAVCSIARVRQRAIPLVVTLAVAACLPEPMSPFGVSDDSPQAPSATPPAARVAPRAKKVLSALASIGSKVANRFAAEGHSYRRFTIEVWANAAARNAAAAGTEAAVGSELVAAHFESEADPVLYLTMRKETLDGGTAWVFGAYDGKRDSLEFDARPCASCHAMARFDGRFTPIK